ncbi:RDD domain-containing protein [Paraglaciecola mesophila KMM 241]|uniref:RDD domain-containing protein n=1 Tax=Paraglaciecola mesophila KMM 241 TaxID=1128912 RepID=K6YXQ6_9ALTE|nr:RDD family protein [Paraglaciecola mesophila]GAC22947.1 RDD domain-containing protein [Paraglaciecola mesophila KMM 241]
MSEPIQSATEDAPVNPAHLSQKETRNMVTPYAFHVSKSLFGTPLARPIKRAFALLIDAALIGLLSQASNILLALIAAITFFRAGNRLKKKKRFNVARISLRFVTAILVFLIAAQSIEFVQEVIETPDENQKVRSELVEDDVLGDLELDKVEDLALIGLTAKYLFETKSVAKDIEYGKCIEPLVCWTTLGEKLATDLATMPIDKKVAEELFSGYRDAVSDDLSPQQKSQLEVAMTQTYERMYSENHLSQSDTKQSEIEQSEVDNIDFENAFKTRTEGKALPDNLDTNDESENAGQSAEQKENAQSFFDTLSEIEGPRAKGSSPPSILAWVQGIAADLGLGFGWAAFYFSIFTAWWHGQTPGKRVLGIQVIKLDGSSLNLWESFGRYGGYGAGIATGLLGFLQIYWDPNRQAIQDKISETLVIDLRNERVEFVHPHTVPEQSAVKSTSNESTDNE